jgi:Transglycosylase SLT domain/SPOR domain
MLRPAVVAVLMLVAGLSLARAEEQAAAATASAAAEVAATEKPADNDPQTICALIEAAAEEHSLPIGFFTRLIWKESRFRPDAVSPKGAEGIAQFMPGTAALRTLSDPFDPIEAIPASAGYLRDLADRFGNLGLAAAAYNSGEQRVEDWIAGSGGLPWETRDYVLAITGHTAEEWNQEDPTPAVAPVKEKPDEGCLEIAARLAKAGAGSELVDRIEKAAWAPWGVQVAGNFSLNRAMASYSRLQSQHAAILGGQPPMVIRAVDRSRGSAPLFQLRVPAATRDEADKICTRLKSTGGACIVLKTGR